MIIFSHISLSSVFSIFSEPCVLVVGICSIFLQLSPIVVVMIIIAIALVFLIIALIVKTRISEVYQSS